MLSDTFKPTLKDYELIKKLRNFDDYEAVEAFIAQAKLLIREVGIVGKPANFLCALPTQNMNIQFVNKIILKLDFSNKSPRFSYLLSDDIHLTKDYKHTSRTALEKFDNGIQPILRVFEIDEFDFEQDVKEVWLHTAKLAYQSYDTGIREYKFNDELYRLIIDEVYKKDVFSFAKHNYSMLIEKNNPPIAPNQILFGPPGTGKTYQTINKSIRIVNPAFDLSQNRHILKMEFDRLLSVRQIGFCTFHQNTGYEDFLEGIKPETRDNKVIYEVKDGIFKQMCVEATYQIYKLHKKKHTQAKKQPPIIDFDTLWLSFVRSLTTKHIFKTKTNTKLEWVWTNDRTNLIVKPQGGLKEYMVSKKRMEAIYDGFKTIDEIRNVTNDINSVIGGTNYSAYWAVFNDLKTFEKTLIAQMKEIESEDTDTENELAYQDKKNLIADFDLQEVSRDILEKAPRYVLVIDEINRGNVAQVFGELITLIEPSKRAGKEEALEVILPYSRERFAVPLNLHIICTMNTADRSVEALDTALRRRFVFEEMMPLPALLESIDVEGIDLAQLLTTINERLELLLDKDHAIGHSYFLHIQNLDDLKNVFKQSILPLLQEYFLGDAGKVNLILGDAFVAKQTRKTSFAKNNSFDQYLQKDLLKREIFHFTDSAGWQASDFQAIYA